jgi:hypothetical protein
VHLLLCGDSTDEKGRDNSTSLHVYLEKG